MTLSPRKRQKVVSNVGYCHLRSLGGAGSGSGLILLRADRLYTLGRSSKCCDVVFDDVRVSRRHCQVLFDGSKRKLYIWDGRCFPTGVEDNNSTRIIERVLDGKARASVNGVFVNGSKIRRKRCTEICVGDEITFVSGCDLGFSVERVLCMEESNAANGPTLSKRDSNIGSDIDPGIRSIGLIASGQKIVPANHKISKLGNEDLIERSLFLLRKCIDIMRISGPVSYTKASSSFDKSIKLAVFENRFSSGPKNYKRRDFFRHKSRSFSVVSGSRTGNGRSLSKDEQLNQSIVRASKSLLSGRIISREKIILSKIRLNGSSKDVNKAIDCIFSKNRHYADLNATKLQGVDQSLDRSKLNGSYNTSYISEILCREERFNEKFSSRGTTYFLNNIDSFHGQTGSKHTSVSLQELFNPVTGISRVFIATFTSDISWFLSHCEIPNLLPVTIACHNSEGCWSASPDKRTSIPFSDYPNLVVVYPPFPEVIAFGKDRKRQGIACHHPKLIVLLREDSIRIIVTSANLVAKQWTSVTNTVWWQDFPCRSSPDLLSLFPNCSREGRVADATSFDFAAQLAGFMASLLVDVPSQADWISDLAQYDFDEAFVYLVASVPGIYVPKPSFPLDPLHFLPVNERQHSLDRRRFLGSVEASVVGLKYRFGGKADANGLQCKMIASFLGKIHQNMHGLSEVLLKRVTNISADANAVALFVCNPDKSLKEDNVQLGFLPKNMAKWISPLSDFELFSFSAYINPKEALAAISAMDGGKVQLILYVSQGPNFSSISTLKKPEYISAFCSLISSLQRSYGLWRLQEVLSSYRWPQSEETDFVYGSSSIGTSINAEFMAAFAAAAGKKMIHYTESEESDPEWGLWNANCERRCPSINILFPTIERVKAGIQSLTASRRLLSLSEKTWQRLKTKNIFHDSVPHLSERVGCPMHVKVARRRFKSNTSSNSTGWVYCGSHNFSAAAWGQPITNSHDEDCSTAIGASTLGYKLLVRNYELGVLFVVPPINDCSNFTAKISNLDDVPLPFIVPPPSYNFYDRPATAQAMREAYADIAAISDLHDDLKDLADTEIPGEEDDLEVKMDMMSKENDEDKNYAEVLWSQVSSSER